MDESNPLDRFKRTGTGLSFIIFPLVFVFAFAGHPDLLSPNLLSPEELILRARNAPFLHFGHALVTLNTALLVVAALHFMTVLDRGSAAWAGFVGGALAILGALLLAADKGALCLTMSALETVPEGEFTEMMPGLLAMFGKKGWLVLLWGLLLLPIGFAIQAVALIRSRALPRWQGIFFLVGVLFVGTPDGAEIINLTAAIVLAVAFVPYGIRLIKARSATPVAET
ncbi:MAG: hypothetical protein HKO65_00085 [Gemmatimonadetes bacterium]|nr:hypothetical protein [Gemmatimonadota bacterium]